MQTINISTDSFQSIQELPIPEGANERLLIMVESGDFFTLPSEIDLDTGKWFFRTEIQPNYLYCHLKVTAATEQTFKVGDRVEWNKHNHINGLIKGIKTDTAIIDIGTDCYEIELTDLTLITE